MKKITTFLLLCLLSLGIPSINAQTRNTLEFQKNNGNSLVDCGQSDSYSPAIFTVEAWVNIYESEGTIISNVQYVDGAGSKGFTIRLSGQRAQLNMGVGSANSDWFEVTATNDIPLNTWTHVAVVFDGSKGEVFYNGVSEGITNGSNPILVSGNPVYLGEHPQWSNRLLAGQLSDVRIWNVARTASEIQASMSSFLSGTETGLVANWKLDEGSGSTANEQVTSTNATVGNGTTWQLNSTLSTNDVSFSNEFNIYQNTSNGIFTVTSSVDGIVSYNVYTISGQLVKTGSFSKVTNSIDLSNESDGVYILRGSFEGKSFVKKLLINK